MKTIEEAKKEASKHFEVIGGEDFTRKENFEMGFSEGVAFAEQWIAVADELPKLESKGYVILTEDLEGAIALMMIIDDSDIQGLMKNYTHWRPINRK